MTFSETINSIVVRRFVPDWSSLWRTQTSWLPYSAVRPLAPRAFGASFFITRRSGTWGFVLDGTRVCFWY